MNTELCESLLKVTGSEEDQEVIDLLKTVKNSYSKEEEVVSEVKSVILNEGGWGDE